MSLPAAVLTDPTQRVALTVARSLGSEGIPIKVLVREGEERGVTLASRHVTEAIPFKGESALLNLVEEGEVLIPISTNTVLELAEELDLLREKVRILLPPRETIEDLNDKANLLERAEGLGLTVPVTWDPEGPDGLDDIIHEIPLPAAVKLRNDEGLYLAPKERYRKATTRDELREAYRILHFIKKRPLVQPWIEGEGVGAFFLYDEEGRPRASFSHLRIREYPITGGPSTCCESRRFEDALAAGEELLSASGWVGPAMVEFRRDAETGKLAILEVNPRYWGSLPLAIAAGVDFPLLHYRLATGEEVEPVTDFEEGMRLRFLVHDTIAAVSALMEGELGPVGSYLRDLVDFKVRSGIWDRSDPMPAIRYLVRF